MHLEEFCIQLGSVEETYKLDDEIWRSIKEVIPPLKLIAEKTTQLQAELLTLSDMFGIWYDLKFCLNQLPQSDFRDDLINCVEMRELKLIESPVALASIYLDPRFRLLLNIQQKSTAVTHLEQLFLKLNPDEDIVNRDELNTGNSNILESHLEEIEKAQNIDTNIGRLRFELTEYEKVARLPVYKNIYKIWTMFKKHYPILYSLVEIVHCVAPTEVCVKCNSSKINFALNRYRTNLKDNEIEIILLISLNQDI